MIIGRLRREFVAKIVADLGKTIFAVGLATYLFEKFSVNAKLLLGAGCVVLILVSIFIQPSERKGA